MKSPLKSGLLTQDDVDECGHVGDVYKTIAV